MREGKVFIAAFANHIPFMVVFTCENLGGYLRLGYLPARLIGYLT